MLHLIATERIIAFSFHPSIVIQVCGIRLLYKIYLGLRKTDLCALRLSTTLVFTYHFACGQKTKDLISDITGGNGSRWKDELENSALAAAGISVPLPVS